MELNAKIASLEDEVKLLKGEVKLILSEIRTAILGQNNPFAGKDAFALSIDPDSHEARPPIRVVKASADENEEMLSSVEPEQEVEPALSWTPEEEEPLAQPIAEASPPPQPVARPPARLRSMPAPPVAPQTTEQPAPQPINVRSWSLVKIAGLAVWAEEALKQIGPERLQVLLDLCEYAGYLPASAREALARVMSLDLAIEERATPPSLNECLVVLYQLDALMRGEEPLTVLRSQAAAG